MSAFRNAGDAEGVAPLVLVAAGVSGDASMLGATAMQREQSEAISCASNGRTRTHTVTFIVFADPTAAETAAETAAPASTSSDISSNLNTMPVNVVNHCQWHRESQSISIRRGSTTTVSST